MSRLLEYKINKVSELLEEGAKFIESFEVDIRPEYRWSQTLAEFAQEMRFISTPESLCEFIKTNNRELFGGMGSFSDLIITSDNKHVVSNENEVNQRLGQYSLQLSEAWEDLKQELKENFNLDSYKEPDLKRDYIALFCGIIKGQVYEQGTSNPLGGVVVKFREFATLDKYQVTITDENGYFSFELAYSMLGPRPEDSYYKKFLQKYNHTYPEAKLIFEKEDYVTKTIKIPITCKLFSPENNLQAQEETKKWIGRVFKEEFFLVSSTTTDKIYLEKSTPVRWKQGSGLET